MEVLDEPESADIIDQLDLCAVVQRQFSSDGSLRFDQGQVVPLELVAVVDRLGLSDLSHLGLLRRQDGRRVDLALGHADARKAIGGERRVLLEADDEFDVPIISFPWLSAGFLHG